MWVAGPCWTEWHHLAGAVNTNQKRNGNFLTSLMISTTSKIATQIPIGTNPEPRAPLTPASSRQPQESRLLDFLFHSLIFLLIDFAAGVAPIQNFPGAVFSGVRPTATHAMFICRDRSVISCLNLLP